jgi:putative endonuclease
MPMQEKPGCVYIMTNRSRTLYVGVTANLERRVAEHKTGTDDGCFTQRYRLDRLVYYERFDSIVSAINREKKIKGLLRVKKIALIVSANPGWRDLSEEWGQPIAPQFALQKQANAQILRSPAAPSE